MVQGCEAEFTAPHFVVNGAHCTSKPVCSLVIAPFEMAAWHIGAPVPAAPDASPGSRVRKGSALARALSLSRT